MTKFTYKVIIAAMLVVFTATIGVFIWQNNEWRQLKALDDQKLELDNKALSACVDGWEATTTFDLNKLNNASDALVAARNENKGLAEKRAAQLKKLGY